MISRGSNSLFEIGGGNSSTFAFVDADNVRGGLARALKNFGFSKSQASEFNTLEHVFRTLHVQRFYFYSAVAPGEQPPAWIAEIRSKNRCIFRNTLLTTKGTTPKQEGVDVYLAVEAMQCAFKKTMDHCVLFSDDGDLLPLINALVSEGIQTSVVSFGNPDKSDVAARMRDACDAYYHVGQSILLSSLQVGLLRNQIWDKDGNEVLSSAELDELDMGFAKYYCALDQEGQFLVRGNKRHQSGYLVAVFGSIEKAKLWLRLAQVWEAE